MSSVAPSPSKLRTTILFGMSVPLPFSRFRHLETQAPTELVRLLSLYLLPEKSANGLTGPLGFDRCDATALRCCGVA
jgi:hypothetical protein